MKSALVSTAGAGVGRHGTDAGGAGDARGRRPRRAAGRRRSASSSPIRSSLSFEDLERAARARRAARCSSALTDAGNGAGTWQVELASQAATPGATLDVPGTVTIPPGGEADVPVVATRCRRRAAQGENYGFVVLRKGNVTRRIPYFFLVDQPALAAATVLHAEARSSRRHAHRARTASTRTAIRSRRSATRPTTPPMNEDGAETVYVTPSTGRQ